MSETVTHGAPARAGDRIHRLSARVGRAPLTLVGRAALAAIADAGQEPTDIDKIARANYNVVEGSDLGCRTSCMGTSGSGGAHSPALWACDAGGRRSGQERPRVPGPQWPVRAAVQLRDRN
jgi:hypothetical protein